MTRKIKSLKENECILISTKREARIIKRKTGCDYTIRDLKGNYFFKNGDIMVVSANHNEVVLPASDFIKLRLKDQLRQLSDRVGKLEVNGMPVVDEHHVNDYSVSEPYNRAAVAQAKSEEDAAAIPVKDAEEVKSELEVGKWAKDPTTGESKFLFYIEDIDESGGLNPIFSYGFNLHGNWSGKACRSRDILKWREATHEEVSAALIEEAKRRGYKEGVVVSELGFTKSGAIEANGFNFESDLNMLLLGNSVIFDNGQWAEIVEQPKEIDWSVPGQLVVNEKNYVWLTSGEHEGRNFEATYMRHGDGAAYKVGHKSNDCVKKMFKPYTGEPIILTNGK